MSKQTYSIYLGNIHGVKRVAVNISDLETVFDFVDVAARNNGSTPNDNKDYVVVVPSDMDDDEPLEYEEAESYSRIIL